MQFTTRCHSICRPASRISAAKPEISRLTEEQKNQIALELQTSYEGYTYFDQELKNEKSDLSTVKKTTQKENKEAWDELEKSIIANLADDVLVGVRKDKVEILIIKKFAE